MSAKSDAIIEARIKAKKSNSHGATEHLGLDSAGASMHPYEESPIEEMRGRGNPAPSAGAHLSHTINGLSNKAEHGIAPSLRDRTVLAKHTGVTNGAKHAHHSASEFDKKAKAARDRHTADVDINVK